MVNPEDENQKQFFAVSHENRQRSTVTPESKVSYAFFECENVK
ncbi:hypothetical protein D9757_004168 [Collybiopsis confluens]|uniref:Uncharacterized protein n=1 Tax=Collybiopsis confluens TaxID=2823264 RepID=A0A8H5MD59_9AGAR|nr:hypothetical protein D9757_004168 [Collybiopsis confluens]